MKKTKIICTIGPATNTRERILELAGAGMNVARVNMSHASHEDLLSVINTVRKANRDLRFPIPVMLDTHGNEIRLQRLDDPIPVRRGELFELRCGDRRRTRHKGASINVNVFKHLSSGMGILIENGAIVMNVRESHGTYAVCKVLSDGQVKSRKAVNIPGLKMDFGGLSAQDRDDIRFAVRHGVDIIMLSFVRSRKDVEAARKITDSIRGHVLVMSKIEDAVGVENIGEIIDASDGIMIARGDLGAEIPAEDVPLVQKKIVDKCLEVGKPVVVATQMMESMIEKPVPTRAEVSDVANAVMQKADLVMLSAETSIGKYPVQCVNAMSRICERIEREEKFVMPMRGMEMRSLREEITVAAAGLARNVSAGAIIVFTKSGKLARLTAKHRPTTPIFAFTQHDDIRHKLAFSRGVSAYLFKLREKSHENTDAAISTLKSDGYLKSGELVVVISDVFKSHKDSQIIEVKRVG